MDNKQIKNSFMYMLPVVVGNLLPMLTLPILTRILTPEDYGLLALSMIYGIFATGLANFGMSVAYERNFFEYRADTKKSGSLLYSTLLFVWVNFAILAVISYLFLDQISNLLIGDSSRKGMVLWAMAAQFSDNISNYYFIYYKNTEDAEKFVAFKVFKSIALALITLAFVAGIRTGVVGILYAQVISGMAVFLWLSRKFIKKNCLSFDRKILIDTIRISYPLTPRLFFGVISSQFDKYMIGLLANIGGVGIYSIGQKVAHVVFLYMTAVQNVFSPQVYKRMFEGGEAGGHQIGTYLTPYAYVCIAIGMLTALFSQEAIVILAPEAYHGSIDVVILLSMLYGFYFFGKQPQLIYAKKTWISSLMTFISIGINIALNIPMILKWGVIGAAWATTIAGFVSGSISFKLSQKYYRIHWEYKRIIAIFGTFFGFSLIILVMRSISVPYIALLAVKMAGIGVYIFIGVCIGVLNRENIAAVKDALKGVGKPLASHKVIKA